MTKLLEKALEKVSKLMIIPLSDRQIMLANDTPQNRRELTRMSLRVFRPQGGTSLQQITQLTTALRVLFDLRFVNYSPVTGDIAVRAPQSTLDAVGDFLDDLREDRPTVMLEIRVYQLSTLLSKELGVTVPTQFSVFNIPSEVNKLVGGSNFHCRRAAIAGAVSRLSSFGEAAGIRTSPFSSM